MKWRGFGTKKNASRTWKNTGWISGTLRKHFKKGWCLVTKRQKEKATLVDRHVYFFENGSYVLSTSTEGETRASFRSGIQSKKNGRLYPRDLPSLTDWSRVDAMIEEDAPIDDDDCPELTDEELAKLAAPRPGWLKESA